MSANLFNSTIVQCCNKVESKKFLRDFFQSIDLLGLLHVNKLYQFHVTLFIRNKLPHWATVLKTIKIVLDKSVTKTTASNKMHIVIKQIHRVNA